MHRHIKNYLGRQYWHEWLVKQEQGVIKRKLSTPSAMQANRLHVMTPWLISMSHPLTESALKHRTSKTACADTDTGHNFGPDNKYFVANAAFWIKRADCRGSFPGHRVQMFWAGDSGWPPELITSFLRNEGEIEAVNTKSSLEYRFSNISEHISNT